MGRIVSVAVIDLTRPVEQKGFKSVALFDFTADSATKVITDTKSLTSGSDLEKVATAYFANGGSSLIVCGKQITTPATDIPEKMKEVDLSNPFYGIIAIVPKANQKTYYGAIKTFAEGNEKLSVLEVNGTTTEVKDVVTGMNSDRVVVFANSKDEQGGYGASVAGLCFPQEEGSITWGNKAVVGIPNSGYTGADENTLLLDNINYITTEKGLVITQFGRTLSGSNADITRSKDWLKNRIEEGLVSALVNNKKIPFTVAGMTMISSALNTIGAQAVGQDMLTEFSVITPDVANIPTNDKANRVLRGVKFIATLSGAVETIELDLEVRL